MQEFMDACSRFVINFVAGHCYQNYFDGIETDFGNWVNSMPA